MFISERTVKAHLGVVFEKRGVRDRLQLVLHMAAAAQDEPAARQNPGACRRQNAASRSPLTPSVSPTWLSSGYSKT